MKRISPYYGFYFGDPLIVVTNNTIANIEYVNHNNRTERELEVMRIRGSNIVAIFRIKVLKVLAILLLLSGVVQAHTPTQVCASGGLVSFKWASIGSSKAVRVTYSGYDTTIAPANATTFASPVGINTKVRFRFDDGYSTEFVVVYDPCALPVVLGYFNVAHKGSDIVLSWQTMNEQNSAYFVIQRSYGDNWSDVDVVKSTAPGGNSDAPIEYSYTIPQTQKAGAEYLGLILLAMAGIELVRRYKKGHWAILFLMVSASCTKSVPTPPYSPDDQVEYRIKHVDFDGQVYYSPVKTLYTQQ